MTTAHRSMVWMAAFVALWAAVEALAAHVLKAYSPYQVVWSRYLVHLLLMISLWAWRDPGSLWRTRRPGFQLSRSLLMLVMPASWALSVQHGVAPSALGMIFWLSPALMVLLAQVFLQERASAWIWIALAVGYAGMIAMNGAAMPLPSLPSLFPLGMALSFALYVVMTRSLRTETLCANLFYTALGVFLVLSPFMPSLWIQPSAHDAVIFAGVGALGFFALWTLDRMASCAPVSVAAPFAYLQLPCSLGMALLLQQERLTRRSGVGVLLIAVAALSIWLCQSRVEQRQTA